MYKDGSEKKNEEEKIESINIHTLFPRCLCPINLITCCASITPGQNN